MKVSTYKKILAELGDIPESGELTIKENKGSQYNESYCIVTVAASWTVGTSKRTASWEVCEG